jgi:hypothetical protein
MTTKNVDLKLSCRILISLTLSVIILSFLVVYYINHEGYFLDVIVNKNLRILSESTDFYTGENVRTINGQIPLVSCPLG